MHNSKNHARRIAALFSEDGMMLPRDLVWEGGVKYKIEHVGNIRSAPAMIALRAASAEE